MDYSDNRYSVSVTLFGDERQISFEVSLDCKEPSSGGSFPQRRYSLERHSGPGHEGVHVQINYHLIQNRNRIGKLYILLKIDSDEQLLDVAEGFIFTMREILLEFDEDMDKVVDHLFNMKYLDTLRNKKNILIERLSESLSMNRIQISNSMKQTSTIINSSDLIKLLEDRNELRPLIGPLM